MIIRDKIEKHDLYFVEQELPKAIFYEIYKGTQKVFQVKNNFDVALKEWCTLVSQTATP